MPDGRSARPVFASEAVQRLPDAPMSWIAEPITPLAERLETYRRICGDSPSGREAFATMETVLEAVDRKGLERLQAKYAAAFEANKASEYKYLDVIYWVHSKLYAVRALGLHASPPMRILDLGAGSGHFAMLCQHYGHSVVSLDIPVPFYDEFAPVLGVRRTLDRVDPGKPLTDFGERFDLVTAFMINFHNVEPPRPEKPYWSLEDWDFLLEDLESRQLKPGGRVWFGLNPEWQADGSLALNQALMDSCERQGAIVNHREGTIDWPAGVRKAVLDAWRERASERAAAG